MKQHDDFTLSNIKYRGDVKNEFLTSPGNTPISVKKILAIIEVKGLGKGDELLVGDTVEYREVAVLEPKLSTLLNSLDKTEGLVIGLACAVDTVLRPNNDSVILHLFSGGLADSVVSADHPGKNADTVGEYYDALGAGAPDGAGKVLVIERMNVSHSDNICRVGMHNDAVLGVLLEPCHVRHEVSGKLACELTAVGIAPEKLCNVAGLAYADNSEVGCGIVVYVLEVLTGTGNEENLADGNRKP